MTAASTRFSPAAQHFIQILNDIVTGTPAVVEAVAVSSDGLLIAKTDAQDTENADRLAAITSAIISLANGASRAYDLGVTNRVIVDLGGGYFIASAISSVASLGVRCNRDADLGQVAYSVAMFANNTGSQLTTALMDELRGSLSM